MRTIKFRAWDKSSSTMIPNISKAHQLVLHLDENDLVLNQFTGLHDKNGKEIYEDDFVEHIKIGGNYKVAQIGVVNIHPTQGVKVGNWPINFSYEVIGNIYENPELFGE